MEVDFGWLLAALLLSFFTRTDGKDKMVKLVVKMGRGGHSGIIITDKTGLGKLI